MSSPNPQVTVSYTYNLPEGITPPELGNRALLSSGTSTFLITIKPSEPGASTTSSTEYYAAVLDAVRESKRLMGEEMTAWRDAVGDKEKYKEKEAASAKKALEDEEDESEDFEEET